MRIAECAYQPMSRTILATYKTEIAVSSVFEPFFITHLEQNIKFFHKFLDRNGCPIKDVDLDKHVNSPPRSGLVNEYRSSRRRYYTNTVEYKIGISVSMNNYGLVEPICRDLEDVLEKGWARKLQGLLTWR